MKNYQNATTYIILYRYKAIIKFRYMTELRHKISIDIEPGDMYYKS